MGLFLSCVSACGLFSFDNTGVILSSDSPAEAEVSSLAVRLANDRGRPLRSLCRKSVHLCLSIYLSLVNIYIYIDRAQTHRLKQKFRHWPSVLQTTAADHCDLRAIHEHFSLSLFTETKKHSPNTGARANSTLYVTRPLHRAAC